MKDKLGPKAMWREVAGANGSYELREAAAVYDGCFWQPKSWFKAKKYVLLGHIYLKID